MFLQQLFSCLDNACQESTGVMPQLPFPSMERTEGTEKTCKDQD